MTEEQDDWRIAAKCRDTLLPDFFFPDESRGIESVKAFCGDCPVRAQCLQFALETGEEHGVWGGLSEAERARLNVPVTAPQLKRCRNGHMLSTENYYQPPKGNGQCLTCYRNRLERHKAARAAA